MLPVVSFVWWLFEILRRHYWRNRGRLLAKLSVFMPEDYSLLMILMMECTSHIMIHVSSFWVPPVHCFFAPPLSFPDLSSSSFPASSISIYQSMFHCFLTPATSPVWGRLPPESPPQTPQPAVYSSSMKAGTGREASVYSIPLISGAIEVPSGCLFPWHHVRLLPQRSQLYFILSKFFMDMGSIDGCNAQQNVTEIRIQILRPAPDSAKSLLCGSQQGSTTRIYSLPLSSLGANAFDIMMAHRSANMELAKCIHHKLNFQKPQKRTV